MKLSDLPDYIPCWPAYHARRIDNAILSDGITEIRLADDGMCAFRLRAVVGDDCVTLILPVPEEIDAPLSHPAVMSLIQEAFVRCAA